MTLVIFYLCLSAVALIFGTIIGKRTESGRPIALLENEFVANFVAVAVGISFLGGLIGMIAMTNYTELTFWTAVGLFVVVQGVLFALLSLLFRRPKPAT